MKLENTAKYLVTDIKTYFGETSKLKPEDWSKGEKIHSQIYSKK